MRSENRPGPFPVNSSFVKIGFLFDRVYDILLFMYFWRYVIKSEQVIPTLYIQYQVFLDFVKKVFINMRFIRVFLEFILNNFLTNNRFRNFIFISIVIQPYCLFYLFINLWSDKGSLKTTLDPFFIKSYFRLPNKDWNRSDQWDKTRQWLACSTRQTLYDIL